MRKKGSQFHTKEFKAEAVKLLKEQGYPISKAARNLGVSPGSLGRWKRAFEANQGDKSDLGNLANMHAKLKRLRKKNKRLELEREILKKAATFFARASG